MGVLARQQRRAVLVIEHARAVRRCQVGDDVRRPLVVGYGRVHTVIVLVLQTKRRIHVTLARRAGIGDVRRGTMMRVRQKSGNRPGRAVDAAWIVISVRELGTLEHPVATEEGTADS